MFALFSCSFLAQNILCVHVATRVCMDQGCYVQMYLTFFIFPPANTQLPHHLPAPKSLMICPLMELYRCHSKSPSKPIPSNHVTGRIHSSTAPSLSTAFPPEAGVPIQFLHRSCAKKRAKKSDQRSTKSFPLNQSKYMNKLLVP